MSRIKSTLACLVLLLAAAPVLGAGTPLLPREKLAPAEFPAVAEWVSGQMGTGGRFRHVTVREREAVERDLDLIRAVLASVDRVEDLDESTRVDLLNAQERINAVLTRRDGERLVCERRTRLGSNRRETWCETYAERETRIRGTRDRANELNRRIQQCDDSGRCVSG